MIKGIKINCPKIEKGNNWERNKNELQMTIASLYSKNYL